MAEKQKVSRDVAYWVGEIDDYEKKYGDWISRSKKIVDRYMDERDGNSSRASRFNILWSNIQTLHPAIYANPPTPNVDRRFEVEDDLGRYASLVLERAVSYYVKNDLFDKVMKQSTLDRLLSGRGVAWVRYCPVFEEKAQITEDAEEPYEDDDYDELESEDVVPDYVHWQDFGHTCGRTWQEVRGVWRRVYMGRAELVKRFGEKGQTVPLDAKNKVKGESYGDSGKKACVYEIWDKLKKKAVWIHKSMPEVLDELDDPLGLRDFFPCPEPIYATLSNDSLVPCPDYVQYQDQAQELDMLTARIASITKAVKVAGIYDASADGIDRLLSEGVENKLLPVDNMATIGGGKGMEGVVSFMPLRDLMETLAGLYQARERVKQDLYEITGISDIVRGNTQASETATAQQIKGQFATLRLDHNQKDVARFSRDLVVMMTEIIAKHFSMDTIKKVSGIKLLTNDEKTQIQMQQQMAAQQAQIMQQQGQEAPPPPELPEEIEEMMGLPSWEDIEALIRDDTARSFRIDIETDSTIKADQESEKQARTEFLTAVSGFLSQAVAVPPELRNLTMEMLLFGVRGFKVSRELETAFESTMSEIRKAEENPPPQQPDPEAQRAAAEQQRTQAEMQMAQMKAQSDIQVMQMKAQLDEQRAQSDLRLKAMDAEMKKLSVREKEIELMIKQADAANPMAFAGGADEADV